MPNHSNQTSYILRLPPELRIIIYEYILADEAEQIRFLGLASISEQVAQEVIPILARRVSGFYWTDDPCDEEWYLAVQSYNETWRMRLINAVEEPWEAMPVPQTMITCHVLVGRHMVNKQDLKQKLRANKTTGRLLYARNFFLEDNGQSDSVKRFVRDHSSNGNGILGGQTGICVERGRAGAPRINNKLGERVWHQQWWGGGRRAPAYVVMCFFQKQSGQQS
ncbi:hypothetical protein KCU65_g9760, partial [Aureobasidium melanogenum]